MIEEKKQLYCFCRKLWIAATPEEQVRQKVLKDLIERLGFPLAYLGVEKELRSVPHLSAKSLQLPERRLDIICYSKRGDEGLHPLLLIECKAVPLSFKELNQVIGYNQLVKASFFALVNQKEIKLGWHDNISSDYKYINYIPSYLELKNSLSY